MISRDVAKEIAKNIAMAIPAIRRWRLERPRAGTAFSGDDEELKRYAFQGLDILTDYIGGVEGKSIIEIGPGDLLTSGMALLAAGASSYTSVDRFVGDYSRAAGKQWYTGIQEAWPRLYPQHPWPDWLDAATFPEANQDRVSALDVAIEQLTEPIGPVDVVCSFQVGEHVSDIDSFARATALMIKPDGVAVHRIDFGPHDVWDSYQDPLVFLRFPDWLWHLMGSERGTPNRRRSHEMIAAFKRAGLSVEIDGVENFTPAQVDISKFRPRFRRMPQESVLVKTIYLVARKD